MTIFQVITKSGLGGAQSVVAHIANSLCHEHTVIVIAGEGNGELYSILDRRVKYIKCSSLQRSLSPLKELKTIWSFRKLYKKYNPDVIHLHSSKAGMLGRIAFPSNKVLYTVHGFDSIRIAFRSFLPIERMMQNFCSQIVGVSKYDVRTLNEEHITKNVSYVYNGIPHGEECPNLSWSIPSTFKKKILCIARLNPQKNHKLFLEIAELLPQYAFVWIGNQDEYKTTLQNVFFLGNIPEAGHYCQLADLFLLTSNYEGLPMVILEAMSYGKPVVASNVGGVSEVVINTETGYALPNDKTKFVEAIKSILENEVLYNKMSCNAENLIREKFTVNHMVQGYVDLYRSMLSNV